MSWGNYPQEFKCRECDGSGEVMCGCCDNVNSCGKCDGEGLVGVDRERMNADIRNTKKSPAYHGEWELVENDVWLGRTDGEHKWYYRDYAASVNA